MTSTAPRAGGRASAGTRLRRIDGGRKIGGVLSALRALLSAPVGPGANTVVVGHAYPYYTLVGGQYLSEGEADVVRPRGADFEVVARVSLKQWRDLAALPAGR